MGVTDPIDDTPANGVTRMLVAQPRMLPILLGLLAVAFLVPVFVYGGKAFFPTTPAAAPGEPPPAPAFNPDRPEHITYTVGGAVGAILAGVLALVALSGSTAPPATHARRVFLAAGSVLGFAVMLYGIVLLVLWFGSLAKWLGEGDVKEAHRVLIPVGVVILGAAMAILSALPARAEERHNQALRRFIYGSNLGVTTLLLVFALLAGNIFLALRVPNKLDTTGSGFYTLGDDTLKYLKSLDTPITIYTTMDEQGDRPTADMRRLLDTAAAANPARIAIRPVSSVTTKPLLAKLREKHPQYNFAARAWVLVAAGEDEARTTFFTDDDVFSERGGTESFTGESRLMRDVLFLSDSKTKAVVYMTQGHGEPAIVPPAPGAAAGRTASALRTILEKNYVDVRPWQPDVDDPKVPDDATVVIIADPRRTLPAKTVSALAAYMTTPRAGGKAGKLIVAASPFPKPDGAGCIETGVEGILLNYGVVQQAGWVLTPPYGELDLSYTDILTISEGSRHPVGALVSRGAVFSDCRPLVVRASDDPDASVNAEVLFASVNPRGNLTWVDRDPPSDPKAQWERMARDAALRPKLGLSAEPRPLAVAVTEAKVPRVVVFASGVAFADDTNPRKGPPRVDLIAASLDWLRDRPSVAAANKTYARYTLPKSATATRLVWLPVGLTLAVIVVAGLGVWVVRRR
jgi:hypothetical protein